MKITNLFGGDKLKQITDQFGEKQSYSPTYTIHLPDGYTNLKWVDKIKDAVTLYIYNCKQITDLSPLEQLDNLTDLGLWDAEKFNTNLFINLSKIPKLSSLHIIGAESVKEVKGISQMKLLEHLYLQALNCENFEEIAELENLSELQLIANKIVSIDFIKQMKKLHLLEIRPAPIKDATAIKNFSNNNTYNSNSSLDICLDANTYLPSWIYGINNVTLRYYHDDSAVNIAHINSFSSTDKMTIVGSINNYFLSELVEINKTFKEINFVYFNIKELKGIAETALQLLETIYATKYVSAIETLDMKILGKMEDLEKVSFMNNDYFFEQKEVNQIKTTVKPKIPESLKFDIHSDGQQVYLSKKTFEKYLSKDGKKLRIQEENSLALHYIDQYPNIEEVDISPYAKDQSIKPLLSLNNLISLYLANKKASLFKELPLFEDKIKELIIINDSESIFDFSYIKNFKQIEKLDIRASSLDHIENISLISNLKSLKTLLFDQFEAAKFDFKNQLPLLTSLSADIWSEKVKLDNLVNLHTLRLTEWYGDDDLFDFKNLSPLKQLRNLTVSDLYLCNSINVEFISELTTIEELFLDNLWGDEITEKDINLNFIAGLKNLKIIRINSAYIDFPYTILEDLHHLEKVDFTYATPDNATLEILLKINTLKEIVMEGDFIWEDVPNPYLFFNQLLMKNVTVTINGKKYSKIPLSQYSEDFEKDYGILYQTKDCDPSSTTTLDIELYGQDEDYVEYSVDDLSILKHFKNLKELTVQDPYNDFNWEDSIRLETAPLCNLQTLEKIKFDSILIKDLNSIGSMPQLKELFLYYSRLEEDHDINEEDISSLKILKVVGDECWNSVSDLLFKFPHLEEISIDNDDGDRINDQILLQFPKLKKIHSYNFSRFFELSEGMGDLSSLNNLEEISQLRLLNHEDIKKFKQIKKIESIYIDEVTDIPDFVESVKNIEIQMMGIGSLEGLPEEFSHLSKLNQSIKNIYIRGGNINEVGDLSFFANLKNLEEIKFSSFTEWTASFLNIAELGKLNHLRVLEFQPYIDKEDFDYVSNLTGFPKLENLNIMDFLVDLSEIKDLPELTTLNISKPSNLSVGQNALPKIYRLEFSALHLADLETMTALPSLGNLTIRCAHKIKDFKPIDLQRNLRNLDIQDIGFMQDIHFIEKLDKLTSLSLHSRYPEGGEKFFLDASPLSQCRNLTSIGLTFKNASIDLSAFTSLGKLEEISLSEFTVIKNIEILSKKYSLKKITLEEIDSIIDLSIFSDLSELTSVELIGCNNIKNADYFDSIEKVQVSIKKSYSDTDIWGGSKGQPFDKEFLVDLETDWVKEKISTKGEDTNFPWAFEFVREKNNFEFFISFFSTIAEKLAEAKSTYEQMNSVYSLQYQCIAQSTTIAFVESNYSQIEKEFLVKKLYSNQPLITPANLLLVSRFYLIAHECLWDILGPLMMRGETGGVPKVGSHDIFKHASTEQKIYLLGKFEVAIFQSENKNLIHEQSKRLKNYNLNDFQKIFEQYSTTIETLTNKIKSMDWTKEDNPFEDITVPDELTEFVILCEKSFSEEAGQIWLEKNEWCKKNYNLMRDTQNIMNELKQEGHKVNEFSFYKELDNRLGTLKPDIFKDKAIQTSKDVVSAEDIYDDNHLWRIIPDFTIAINLENQNPVFELFDCTDLVDISSLEQLPHLRELILNYCSKLEDTSPIGKLVNLSKLEISMCGKLTDISPLANLKNLTHLNIRNASLLKDISPLKNNTKLKKLFLYGCKSIKDLSSLKGLKELEIVVIPHCRDQLPDLSPLLALPNLHEISLDNCTNAIDLSQLEAFENLESLLINHSGELTILPQFPLMPKLFRFALICSPLVSDIASLESLKILEVLHIDRSCWYLENLDPLRKLRHLRTLTLSECTHLDDISSIQKLPKLDDVDISGCPNLKNYNKEEFIRRPNIEEPQVIEEIDNELSNLTTSSSNIENIGDLLLPSGKLLVRDFDYLGYWGSGRGLSDHRHKSVVYFPKDTTVTIHIEKSKERVPLSILITPKDTNDLQNTHWKFAGYLICDGGGLIIVQDLLGMKKAKDDKKYQEYMDALTKDIGKEPEKDFLPTISQPGCLINNSYGSTLFPVFIKCNGLKQIERMIIDLDHLKVRRTLGAKGEVKDHLKQMQDYFFKSVTQENPNGPYFLITRPHPLNELNPDFRIHRWEMFLMAKGINMPDEYYKEYPEEYGKVIGGWLGQMYQRGEATRRRKDNGMIELYADQDIAMHFFTKGSSGKPTN